MNAKPQSLAIPGSRRLPDTRDYTDRVEIRSATSKAIYIVARHKVKNTWSCSCFGWLTHRKCKHLKEMGLLDISAVDAPVHQEYEGARGTAEQWRAAREQLRPAAKTVEVKSRRLERI